MITNNLEYDGITSGHGRSVPFQTRELSPNFGDGLKNQAAAWA
jgi:hypothetical protein